MRRTFASLLLALFSFSLISPALLANSPSELPICCRRDGKHQCVISERQTSAGGTSVQSTQSKCPMFPRGNGAPPNNYKPIFVPVSVQFFAPDSAYPEISTRIDRAPHASTRGEVNKRGPPINS